MPSTTPELCVSLLPETMADLRKWLPLCRQADLIELRLDHLQAADLSALREMSGIPLIAAWRSAAEGGSWNGDARHLADLLNRAAAAGFDYLDLEWHRAGEVLPRLTENCAGRLVLSCHANHSDFEKLQTELEAMIRRPAAVYKLVFPARTLNHSLIALRLQDQARKLGKPFVVHAMGEAGEVSRLIGALRGNRWTYVSLPGRPSAPGQFTLQEAKTVYFLKEKNRHSRLVGLVGNPLMHSPGRRLHNTLLHRLGKPDNFIYLNFPAEDFSSFWKGWSGELSALSITMPFKEQIPARLDALSKSVELSGVCNTAVRRNGRWWGFNTDLLALAELLRLAPDKRGKAETALVIGTGATARSAIVALQQNGYRRVWVSGRNQQRGLYLSGQYGVEFILSDQLDARQLEQIGVIVQTTSLGMRPESDPLPPGNQLFRAGQLVLDAVYQPEITPFLQAAAAAGCRVISGVEMFLRQAAAQFRLFSGGPVTLPEVRRVWQQMDQ